jgi:hypothetical protein
LVEALNLETKKTVVIIFLIVILLVSVISVGLLLNERPQGEEYKAIAETLLNEAREKFEDIRGVSVREGTLQVVNISWVIETWGTAHEESEIEKIRIEEKIYKTLFMISQDVNLFEVKSEWTERFRAAEWQGKIYIVEENFDVRNEFEATSTMIHELTHIMQDSYSLPQRITFDGAKALTSLKEGDATFMDNNFENGEVIATDLPTTTDSETNLSELLSFIFRDEIQLIIPDTINDLNRFPYRYGLEFVEALYANGDLESIEKAYENPPNTTEQIMHPEKYFAQEDAQTVKAASITSEWNQTKTDQLGEYFIVVMLDKWISETEAKQAAKGWGGDNFTYYEKDESFLFTWNIAWDSKDDAQEFYFAFKNMMDLTPADKQSDESWFAYEQYLSIQLNENSTLIQSLANETILLS